MNILLLHPPGHWILPAATLVIGFLFFFLVKHTKKYGFIQTSPQDKIEMSVSPIKEEYDILLERIINASTKSELSVLESQALEFKIYFGSIVDDLFEKLTEELNIRFHQITCRSIQKFKVS